MTIEQRLFLELDFRNAQLRISDCVDGQHGCGSELEPIHLLLHFIMGSVNLLSLCSFTELTECQRKEQISRRNKICLS
jgi:hypothetical protein